MSAALLGASNSTTRSARLTISELQCRSRSMSRHSRGHDSDSKLPIRAQSDSQVSQRVHTLYQRCHDQIQFRTLAGHGYCLAWRSDRVKVSNCVHVTRVPFTLPSTCRKVLSSMSSGGLSSKKQSMATTARHNWHKELQSRQPPHVAMQPELCQARIVQPHELAPSSAGFLCRFVTVP